MVPRRVCILLTHLTLSLVFIAGCTVDRGVRAGNVFYSSARPNITIKIDERLTAFQLIHVDSAISTEGDWADTGYWTIYPFISTTSDKYIDRAVLIRFGELRTAGSKWMKGRGTIQRNLDGIAFNFYSGPFYDKTLADMVQKEGYRTDRRYVATLYDRIVSDNLRMHIVYLELVPRSLDNPQWQYRDRWSEQQRQFMQDVIDRGEAAFRILNFSSF